MEDVFPIENGDIPASYVSLPARTRYSQNSPILDNSCEFPFHGLSSQLCHGGIRTKKTTTTQQLALRPYTSLPQWTLNLWPSRLSLTLPAACPMHELQEHLHREWQIPILAQCLGTRDVKEGKAVERWLGVVG